MNGFSANAYCWCVGGAERLIVDAAVELASHGHDVHVFTAHHDKSQCFEETLDGEEFFELVIETFVIKNVNKFWR